MNNQQLYKKNCLWLKATIGENESSRILKAEAEVRVNNEMININGKRVYEDVRSEIILPVMLQILKPRNIRHAKYSSDDQSKNVNDIAKSVISSVDEEVLKTLPLADKAFVSKENKSNQNYVCLGSMTLLAFEELSKEEGSKNLINSGGLKMKNINSITLIESDTENLHLLLNMIDIEEFVSMCKIKRIGFHLIVEEDKDRLIEKIFNYFTEVMPCQLFRLSMVKEERLNSILIAVDSWLFSESGIGYRSYASLGFTTDEINQIVNGSINYGRKGRFKHLIKGSLVDNLASQAIVVASGPSLDRHIEWLEKNCRKFTIFASSSSVKTLLRNNIACDFLVINERNVIVYDLLKELKCEYSKLSEITLICSDTVDPRIPSLFKQVVFFQRPRSSICALYSEYSDSMLGSSGPEAVNCSIETAYLLGFKNIFMLGCDFGARKRAYPRSEDAMGPSPRALNLPVMGNLGRTVFSQPSLLMVRDSIEWFAGVYSDLKLIRCGEGVELTNSKTIDILDESVSKRFVKDKIKISNERLLRNCIERNNPQSAKEKIPQYKRSLNKYCKDIMATIEEESDWNIEFERKLKGYLYWSLNSETEPFYDVASRRTMRFCVFHLLHTLYDNADSIEEFKIAKKEFGKSIKQIEEIILIILKAVEKYAEHSDKGMEDWSPEVIKKFIV
ncbi:6-hydroxymethylpterin diphosphokinase MptE-like protein [Prochlorococcus marinus]|uniref:6-hydroxymethylpterin diphosphokinase MptE-like domain-containing protein n=1 Tax=Prochlorococcus marinus (strain MIT 9303) TaxID=59922 RepID=A2C5W8_PROM3|nr:6-hydroxymethylpterin diphosphokinase MptE-like protein [Prochlorococcus marinus]ABM76878.1 Hypothetical protein P9303_01231 [Prochlorococcus marinus str. MIT 9303]